MMGNNEPVVSIIIPVYNEEEYIGRTLDSLLNQTYDNIELIIVDDNSSDDSLEIIRDKTSNLDNAKILSNRTNMGQTFSINRGAMVADGDYIIFHDADDVSTPDRVAKQVLYMENNPEVGVLGGAFYYIHESRNERTIKKRPTDDEEIRKTLIIESGINIGTAVFRSEALYSTNIFKSAFVEGYELIIEIAKNYKLANLEDPLYVYHINEGSRSQNRQLRKKLILMKRSMQAIYHLDLGYRYIPISFGWLIYLYSPNRLKDVIRKTFSSTEEESISGEEKDELESLIEFKNIK